MKLTDKLDLLMDEKKINKMELSKHSGIPYTTIINFYEKGTENVKLSTLRKLANYFNVSLDYLADDEEERRNLVVQESPGAYVVNKLNAISFSGNKKIPVVGVIRAGEPILAEENIIGYVELPADMIGNESDYFGLKVVGDSMNLSRILDGDTVIVKKQSYLENGEIGVLMVNGYEATVKKFYQTDTTVTLIPNSSNPAHSPQVYDLTKIPVAVLGKVVKAIIDF